MEYQQQEYVMQFLMGLNESLSQARAHILLMDPLPPLTKVFSYVVQEDRQRAINNGVPIPTSAAMRDPSHSAAITVAANLSLKPKRDRPFCTHCCLQGHIVDRCYKLHDFPLAYKPKTKQVPIKPQANQVATTIVEERASKSLVKGLTTSQCQ